MARGSWEDRDYSHLEDRRHGADSDDDPDSDVDCMLPHECSKAFMDYLVELKMTGVLSAKAVCVLSFWAKKGGLAPPGDELALAPGFSGGRYSTHFDKVIGLNLNQDWYTVAVPGHRKHDASRGVRHVAVKPAFEAIQEELDETPGMWTELEEQINSNVFPDCYMQHPLVVASPRASVLPLGIYVDGVQYQKRDSTVAFWCINLVTGRRHLLAALPKREHCRCGCHGHCSLYPIMLFINWCFAAMIDGQVPDRRHDGVAFDETSARSLGTGGGKLGWRAVAVIFKGDWAEFATTLGFRSWAHHTHPCHRCFATGGEGGNMRNFEGLTARARPHAAKTLTHCENACAAREIWVEVPNAEVLANLVANLKYDKRKRGAQGRALLNDIGLLGLRKGDRLNPSPQVLDIGAIDFRTDFPFRLCFWRARPDDPCRFRCPLFSRESMLSPELLCVDEMHTLHLGIFQDYILGVFWACIRADVWMLLKESEELSDQYYQEAALVLKADLFSWYKREKREHPDRPLYEMADFGLSFIGSLQRPHLHAKAAESGSLLRFASHLAHRHMAVLPHGRALVEAGLGLIAYLDATRQAPWRLDATARRDLTAGLVTSLRRREDAGVAWKPKAHLCTHMPKDASFLATLAKQGLG